MIAELVKASSDNVEATAIGKVLPMLGEQVGCAARFATNRFSNIVSSAETVLAKC